MPSPSPWGARKLKMCLSFVRYDTAGYIDRAVMHKCLSFVIKDNTVLC